jgi:hypothetical protein
MRQAQKLKEPGLLDLVPFVEVALQGGKDALAHGDQLGRKRVGGVINGRGPADEVQMLGGIVRQVGAQPQGEDFGEPGQAGPYGDWSLHGRFVIQEPLRKPLF